jgi:hypothetical protein
LGVERATGGLVKVGAEGIEFGVDCSRKISSSNIIKVFNVEGFAIGAVWDVEGRSVVCPSTRSFDAYWGDIW